MGDARPVVDVGVPNLLGNGGQSSNPPPPELPRSRSTSFATSASDPPKRAGSKLHSSSSMMELRRKTRAMLSPVSSPNIDSVANHRSGSSSTTGPSPEPGWGRKLSHRASDSRLLTRFNVPRAPPLSANVSSSSTEHSLQFGGHTPPTRTSTFKLPTTREGMKKWLIAKKLISSDSGLAANTPERLVPGTEDPFNAASTSRLRGGEPQACTACR